MNRWRLPGGLARRRRDANGAVRVDANRHLNCKAANTNSHLFKGNANPVLLDPEDSAVEHDATMLRHKLKPIREVVRIRYIDGSPMGRNIRDTAADAHPIVIYLRGMIDCCSLPILGHDEPPGRRRIRAEGKWQDNYANPYLDLIG